MAEKQNPGLWAGASCDQIGVCSHKPSTPHHHQTQFLKTRFAIPRSVASVVSKHCFGEATND